MNLSLTYASKTAKFGRTFNIRVIIYGIYVFVGVSVLAVVASPMELMIGRL